MENKFSEKSKKNSRQNRKKFWEKQKKFLGKIEKNSPKNPKKIHGKIKKKILGKK